MEQDSTNLNSGNRNTLYSGYRTTSVENGNVVYDYVWKDALIFIKKLDEVLTEYFADDVLGDVLDTRGPVESCTAKIKYLG